MEICYVCYWYNSLTSTKICKLISNEYLFCPEPELKILRTVDYHDWVNRKRKGLINACLLAYFDPKQTNLSEFR